MSIKQRVELKRLEHERQRHVQRKIFEDQMRVLEHQQAQELLSIPYDPNLPNSQHLAVSAPTTPPRINAVLANELFPGGRSSRSPQIVDPESLLKAVGSAVSDKRKSVTYAPSFEPEPPHGLPNGHQSFTRPVVAKSMPASRRTSASGDDEELAGHLQGLSLVGDRSNRLSPAPPPRTASVSTRTRSPRQFGDENRTQYGKVFNAGMMLDQQLDQEMHSKPRLNFSKISKTLIHALWQMP
jgi:hypothetical protein